MPAENRKSAVYASWKQRGNSLYQLTLFSTLSHNIIHNPCITVYIVTHTYVQSQVHHLSWGPFSSLHKKFNILDPSYCNTYQLQILLSFKCCFAMLLVLIFLTNFVLCPICSAKIYVIFWYFIVWRQTVYFIYSTYNKDRKKNDT